jgi:hypothetical protein
VSDTVVIPRRWAKLLRALMGLSGGRYQIVISVWPTGLDYSILSMGDVHVIER